MSFNLIGGWTFALGATFLACLSFLLQRLKTRYRQVKVPTTLFWKEAVEESQARVLVRRFRHPWAYALILFLALTLWLCFANPQFAGESGDIHEIFVVDSSADAAVGSRLARSKELLLDTLGGSSSAHVEVFALGSQPKLLLAQGESSLLLRDRLSSVVAEAVPSTVRSFLERLHRSRPDGQRTRVRLVGFSGFRWSQIPGDSFHVSHLRGSTAVVAMHQGGIRACGFAPARSGAVGVVDVLVEIDPESLDSKRSLQISLDGKPLKAQAETIAPGIRILRDVVANGAILAVGLLPKDAFQADDEAKLLLPTWRPIRVESVGALPRDLALLLETNQAIDTKNTPADVLIGSKSEASLPALILDEEASGLVVEVRDISERSIVKNSILAGIDLNALRRVGKDEISETRIRISADGVRRVFLPTMFLAPERHFTARQDFPVLIDRVLTWLSDAEETLAWAAVGEELPASLGPWTDEIGRRVVAAGLNPVARHAGIFSARSGKKTSVSYFAQDVSLVTNAAQELPFALVESGAASHLLTWLGLLAFAVLVAEWHFLRTSRIP